MYYDKENDSFVFEVGEKVKIASGQALIKLRRCGDRQGLGICGEMYDAAGKTFEIMSRYRAWNGLYRYHLKGIGYTWADDFFECPLRGGASKRIPPKTLRGILIARELSDSIEMRKFLDAVAMNDEQMIASLFIALNTHDQRVAKELSKFCGFSVPYYPSLDSTSDERKHIHSYFI